MAEQTPAADGAELLVDPADGAVLVQRLRLAAEALGDEFAELSRDDAERLVFAAAHEVLSVASVVQFVPTFAERRARRMLATGEPLSGGGRPESAADIPRPLPPPERPEPPAVRPPSLPYAARAALPPWPDAFYTTEAKRLLEKARGLRATARAGTQRTRGTTGA